MSGIINVTRKKNMCVIELVIFYENGTTNQMKVFRLLSCVIYYVIDNYVCVEYICCQAKTLSVACCDNFFEKRVIMNYLVLAFQKC